MKIIIAFLFVYNICYSQDYFNSITTEKSDISFVSKNNINVPAETKIQNDLSYKERIIIEYKNLELLNKAQLKADNIFKNKIHYLINYQKSDSSKNSIKLYKQIEALNADKKKYIGIYSENLKYLKGDTLNSVIRSNKDVIKSLNEKLNNCTDSIQSILSENQEYSKVELGLLQKIKAKNDYKREAKRSNIEIKIEELKDSIYHSILIGNKDKNKSYIKSKIGNVDLYKSSFRNPIDGNIFITSPFGERIHPESKIKHFHNGIDIRSKGSYVYSILPGKVGRVKYDKKLGIYIEIIHNNGLKSIYGHLEKINVLEGETINQMVPLGITGNTGTTTGPHLHFIIKKNNKAIDPARILKL